MKCFFMPPLAPCIHIHKCAHIFSVFFPPSISLIIITRISLNFYPFVLPSPSSPSPSLFMHTVLSDHIIYNNNYLSFSFSFTFVFLLTLFLG